MLDLNFPDVGVVELLSRSPDPFDARPGAHHARRAAVRSKALAAGAQGYVSKNASPEELLLAIKRAAAGGRYVEQEIAQALILQPPTGTTLSQLAPRDLEILRHLAAGRSLAEIADTLGIGYKTIANNCSLIKANPVDVVRRAFTDIPVRGRQREPRRPKLNARPCRRPGPGECRDDLETFPPVRRRARLRAGLSDARGGAGGFAAGRSIWLRHRPGRARR